MRIKNIKKAFTLAEIMLVIMIIGVIAAIMVQILNPQKYKEKGDTLMASKAIEMISSVSSQIRQNETEMLYSGKFMLKDALGAYSYAVLSSKEGAAQGAMADAEELADLFGSYMKKDGNIQNFCNYSGAPFLTPACNTSNVKGFRLPGNLYVGFEIYNNIKACPAFRMPDDIHAKLIPTQNYDGTTKQCWGALHVDTNGKSGLNKPYKDYFVFGMDEYGIVLSGTKQTDENSGEVWNAHCTSDNGWDCNECENDYSLGDCTSDSVTWKCCK